MKIVRHLQERGMGFHAPLFYWFFIFLWFNFPAHSQTLPGDYVSLFNDVDLQGWTIQWPGLWWVENGILYGKQDPESLDIPGSRGDSWLFSNREWDDFSLSLRFKITTDGNSGIGFRMPSGVEGRPSQYGYEMQIWKNDPDYPTGSIYLHAVATQNLHRDEQWNQVEITALGNHATVFINREKVVDTTLSGSLKGRIGLQIHGAVPKPDQLVQYQSIHIKDLKPQETVSPSPFAFEAVQLDTLPSEGCAVADINQDGWLDITCGPTWFEGPSWTPHTYRTVTILGKIMDNSNEIPMDVNQDGWMDIITGGWYSGKLEWWENPGSFQQDQLWQSHLIADDIPRLEGLFAYDVDGDGHKDILPTQNDENAPLQYFAFAGVNNTSSGFERRVIAPVSQGIGNGFGDIDGDGQGEWLTPSGWYKQEDGTASWTYHSEWNLDPSGISFQLDDLNQDGKTDVLVGLEHGFGLSWLERPEGQWLVHPIDSTFSQIHSIALADMDGDGTADIITGKRYLANNGFDPGYNEPLGLFWYKVEKGSEPVFTKYVISYDDNIGTGLGVQTDDLDNDGDLDIVAPGKTGLYILINKRIDFSAIRNWFRYE